MIVERNQAGKGRGPATRTSAYGLARLEAMFAETEASLVQASRLLSPYEAHMAAFHFKLLRQELLKPEAEGKPGADIVIMAGTWLLARVTALAPALLALLCSPIGQETLARAGETAVTWAKNRVAAYEARHTYSG